MKYCAVSSAALLVCVSALPSAFAGERAQQLVNIDTANRIAYGSTGAARNSTDAIQSIACEVSAYVGDNKVYSRCYAQDTKGNFADCYSSEPQHAQVAQSVGPDSWIRFSWQDGGPNGDICSEILVSNSSINAIKKP